MSANGNQSGTMDWITIRVSGTLIPWDIDYKVRPDCHLYKLMEMYEMRVHAPVGSLLFFYEGRRIHDMDTPLQLGLQNNAKIASVQLQE